MDIEKLAERCMVAESCLPDAPYRTQLCKLHQEMLDEIARLRAEVEALRVDAERLLAALVAVRAALEYENEKGDAITDTLWMIPFDYTGTVFDYIDAAIDAARANGESHD